MDQNLAPQGPVGRKFHIAHRRSPSELTPLMSKSCWLAGALVLADLNSGFISMLVFLSV